MADDEDAVAQAVDELYSADPDSFMERRSALSAAAKQSGNPGGAKQIAALRKPTRSAYAVNVLARTDPDGVAELLDLGSQLRDAEQSVDAKQIRELTTRRRRLIDELTKRALDILDESSPSSAIRDEVVSTLTAALADSDVADQVADATLVKPARWEGFGFGGGPDLSLVPSPPVKRSAPTKPAKAPVRKGMSKEEAEEVRRVAAEQEAEARELAKAAAAAAKQQKLDDARRAVDEAEEAVILATDEEQTRLERLQRLEEQVTDARKGVDEARIQLRRAEIRQRRAQDTLRRLER